jgi:hypothetical protein
MERLLAGPDPLTDLGNRGPCACSISASRGRAMICSVVYRFLGRGRLVPGRNCELSPSTGTAADAEEQDESRDRSELLVERTTPSSRSGTRKLGFAEAEAATTSARCAVPLTEPAARDQVACRCCWVHLDRGP